MTSRIIRFLKFGAVFALLFYLFNTGTVLAYTGGDGTPGNPYQISTCTDLQSMGSDLSKSFIITADIDCSATNTWNSGAGFAPIGSSSAKFTGSINGASHTINGLYINRPAQANVGLFGYVSTTATINSLKITNGNVHGGDSTGILIGTSEGVVSGCSASGVSTGNVGTGGLIGSFSGASASLSNSNSSATVNAGWLFAGGLVGYGSGWISGCYATGNVTGGTEVGGLTGFSYSVVDSYATGSVNGSDEVGGLVGENYWQIVRTFATGRVTGSTNVGGLIGKPGSFSTITSSYYDKITTGLSDSGKGVGKTTAEMQTQSTFSGWAFPGAWNIDVSKANNSGYPYLSWQIFPSSNTTLLSAGYDIKMYGANGTISLVPYATGKAAFLSSITMDESHQTWNSSAVHDPVINGDTLTVTAEDGNTKVIYTIHVLEAIQVPATSSATLDVDRTEAYVSSTSSATITAPVTVTNPTVNISAITLSEGEVKTATMPSLLLSAVTNLSTNPVKVIIPTGATLTAPSSWDGIINMPQVKDNSSVFLPEENGKKQATSSVVEIGAGDMKIVFNAGVRILLPGQAGKSAGYVRGTAFTRITALCSQDSQAYGNSLPPEGDCKMDSGKDMVIWTKHFTKFITYSAEDVSDGQVSVSVDMPKAPTCHNETPWQIPDLFQINVTNNSATVYFTPVSENLSSYFIAYSNNPSAEQFGVTWDEEPSTGVRSYTVNSLAPGATYYFKVRGGNGCAPGGWSNTMKIKTLNTSGVGMFFRYGN